MEPSPASAVQAEASTAVTETAANERTTAAEVNSTQATAAAPASASPVTQKEPTANEPTAAAVGGESKREETNLAQPAGNSDPLPGSSSSSSSSSGKSPEITTTSLEQATGEPQAVKKAVVLEQPAVPKQDEAIEAAPTSTNRFATRAPRSACEVTSESVTTSSSSGGAPSLGPSPPAADTPPPEVESSTASPDKDDAGMTCTVDSSSGSRSPPRRGETAVNLNGCSNNVSDHVNSIGTCSSSSSSSSRGKGESHQAPGAMGGTTTTGGREASATRDGPVLGGTPIRSSSTTVVGAAAVIEDNLIVDVERPAEAGSNASPSVQLPEPPTSSERKLAEGRDRLSGRGGELPGYQHGNHLEDSSVGSSTNENTHTRQEKQHDTQPSENRESAPVPPEPDPGPSSSILAEEPLPNTRDHVNGSSSSSTIESSTTKSDDGEEGSNDSNKSVRTAPDEQVQREEANGGNTSGRGNDYQPQAAATPNARNPLLFTEVANDEVELKVDGGHLLDRVIKLSLLKGLQDSGKRLAKSSLIISGAGANGEGSNGEATLATTSSLSKAKNAAGLRLVEESKTTPPALVPSASVPLTNGAIGETVSVMELASSSKEVVEYHHQHHHHPAPPPPLPPPPPRVRHSSETMVSSGSGEIEDSRGGPPSHTGGGGGGAWSSGSSSNNNSNSALDFREEGKVAAQSSEPQRATHSPSDGYAREPVASSDHLPVKARKPQYYASIPDFSKQSKFSPATPASATVSSPNATNLPSSSVTASSSTSPAKSLAQLHMKTPDFSRLGVVSSTASTSSSSSSSGGVVVSQSSPPVSAPTTCSTAGVAGARTTSELKISNPDFTKVPGFAHLHQQQHLGGSTVPYPGSMQPLGSNPPLPPPHGSQVPPSGSTPFVSQDTFSKLIKERNYISDLQLKNPPPSNGSAGGSTSSSGALASAGVIPPHNDTTVKRGVVVVDTTTTSSGSVPKTSSMPYESYTESAYQHHPHHRRSPSTDNGMDLEPQAHVIHKKSGRPQSTASGGVPKNWNPPEFSSTHFTQPPQPHQGSLRPPVAANGAPAGGPSSSSSSSPSPAPRDPSPAPSSASSSSASPYAGGYGALPYPGAPAAYGGGKHQPSTERIIVNNVRTYYPEQAPVPAAGGAGSSSKQMPPQQQHYHHPLGLPKVKDPEFRLDHGKEQQLLQEGTIITVKQPYVGTTPTPRHPAAARSPSAERREAQMLQNSQEILYRDYRQHKRPSSAAMGGSRASSAVSQGPSQGAPPPSVPPQGPPGVGDRRSPYDSTSSTPYYHPIMHPHHHRGSIHPQQSSGPGLMHPPPPNWPAGPGPPPPQRGGPAVARSSPHDNGASPVSSPAPPPGGSAPSPNHTYHMPQQHQHHHPQQHPQQHGGQQYKNSNSPVSGSAYGSASSPTQPMAAGKYHPPQGPFGANVDRRPETERDHPPYSKGPAAAGQPVGYFKGLDYNMEQKFAEVYQAHQAKEKQAAEAATTPGRGQPSRGASRNAGSPGVSSASSVGGGGGGSSKALYGAYEPYGNAYAYHPHSHHSQATPSPTSTPSPVPSPHHRKYSGPPSRDPSPLGQPAPQPPLPPPASQQPQQPHQRHGPNETLYHTPLGYAGLPKATDHAANGSHGPNVAPQQAVGAPYHPHQPPPSSSAYAMSPYAGSNAPQQQSVISTAYERYQSPQHAYGGGPSSQGHHAKSLPYLPPARQQQQQPPPPASAPSQPHAGVAPTNSIPSPYYTQPSAVAAESAVIQPPVGSKNIPVRVIATAPPAAAPSKASSSGQQSGPAAPSGNARGPSAIAPQMPGGQATMSSSAPQGVVQVGPRVAGAGDGGGLVVDGGSTTSSSVTGAAIITPAKRESPLDLSVKTVKTKADSTGCDDYGNVSASNSSISSSSSSNSSTCSIGSGGSALPLAAPNNRSREVVPKVDFNPNFNKHIAPSSHSSRGTSEGGASGAGGPPVAPPVVGRPLDPLPVSQPRHVSVISPVIPPGYDKKTDAYLSASYRAVGGPLASPAYQYPSYASRGPPTGYDPPPPPPSAGPSISPMLPGPSKPLLVDPYSHPKQSTSGPPGSAPGSASSKSVYYPPAAAHPPNQPPVEYVRSGKSSGGSIVTGQVQPPPSSTGPRPSGSLPATSAANASPAGAPPPQPRIDDPRIEDRKFVESMLKKKTSPSSDVIADLQSGRFPTRLPQSLVPKKRAAAAAAAAAAAEAAQAKAAGAGVGSNAGGVVPSPAKVGKYEERREHGQETSPPGPAFERHQPLAPVSRDGPPYHAPPSHSTKPYGTMENQSPYGSSAGKRPGAPETAVHPSVITTNYHHQTPVALQQQQQQHPPYPPDMRYYQQHMPSGQSKPREDPAAPIYHQPHLRGGSSIPYGYPPQYHPDQQQQQLLLQQNHHLAYQHHKDPSGQPALFRYGAPPKSSPPEATSVLQMQSHIHYSGSGVPVGHAQKEYQPQQPHPHPPLPHHHQQQQQLGLPGVPPTGVEIPGSVSMTRAPYAPYGAGSFMVGPAPPSTVPQPAAAPPQHRGADQSVISKLRESLEHKEYEKQRINQLRKLPSGDPVSPESSMHAAPTPTTPVTPDAPSSSSARFRTKGELKGYTPLPLPPSVADGGPVAKRGDEDTSPAANTKEGIKEEAKQPPAEDAEGTGAPLLDILDWGSTCNEFVEQLQTGKKRGRRKRSSGVGGSGMAGRGWRGLGPDGGELMAVGDGSSADLSAVPKDVLNSARSPNQHHRLHAPRSRSVSSSDEDKPLLHLLQQSQQGQDQRQPQPQPQQPQQVVDSHTRNILLSTVEKLTDKLARNMREKQRLEQEQKHEAKLGRSSSTDSDTARLASAAAQRAKARVRKLRHRSSIVSSSVLKSSDGDGDLTADEEEPRIAKGASVGKRPPAGGHQLANSNPAAKRKRLERRSTGASSPLSSSSSSEGEPPEAEPEVVRRKRGRPKGSLGGAKRAQQQATMSRCQAGTLKQDPNANSDLSSDDDKPSKALRTPPTKGERGTATGHGRAVGSESSAKKQRGDGAGNGGASGGGSKGQQVKHEQSTTTGGTSQQEGKVKHSVSEKEKKKSTDNDGTPRKDEQAANGSGASKKPMKQRTTSRSKTPQGHVHRNTFSVSGSSSASSSSSSSSSSASSEEEEEKEKEDRETMTRSKSKREAERRRSNSKVLRNDKIVENLSAPTINHNRRARIENERTPTKQSRQSKNLRDTPSTGKRSKPAESDSDRSAAIAEKGASGGPKKKRTRLASKNVPSSSAESDQDSSSGDGGGADDDDGEGTVKVDLSERLRTRRSKNGSVPTVGGGAAAGKTSSKSAPTTTTTTTTSTSGRSSRSRRESTAAKSGREESSAKKKQSTAASGSCSSGGGRGVQPASRKGILKELTGGPDAVPDHFYPGWEKELYEYKRSLKVPPELITIGGKLYMHRISTSLPDLDTPHHSDGSETFSEIVKINQKEVMNVGNAPPKRIKTKGAAKQQQPPPSNGKSIKIKEEAQQQQQQQQQLMHEQEQLKKKMNDNEKFSSIIELLHRRCVATALQHQGKCPAAGAGKQKGSSKGSAKASVNNNNNNEVSLKPRQEFELLPTPGVESESLFAKSCKKTNSLFDTAIFKSRTRTEQKAMQSKEMIREVFGADEERPQSAPPLRCGGLFEEGIRNVTYDEKYNELMRNVDRIVDELDGGGGGGGASVSVKQEPDEDHEEEDDDEEEEDRRAVMDEDDETQDSSVLMKDSERDTPSIASERDLLGGTPVSFRGLAIASTPSAGSTVAGACGPTTSSAVAAMPEKKRRGRGHRTSRRKGSSGFDYIRKKKKPSQQHHNNHANGNQHHRGPGTSSSNANGMNGIHGESFPRKKFTSAYENLEVKDETHISKEIRSWVLNKGVGESVMHKAARLGYTDVIVYCLERLDMDPDLKDNAGYTPLHEACAKGHLDIAHYLLQYGASHSEPAPSGMRPLHEAVENSFIEIVRLLLAFGADPMLATYAGLTPVQLAESDSMTRFLKDHVNDVQSMGPNKTAWKFEGPWRVHDPEESGCNVFANVPGFGGEDVGSELSSLNSSARSNCTGSSGGTGTTISPSGKRCDSNSNIMNFEAGCPKSVAQDVLKLGQENGISTVGKTDGGIVRESPSAAMDGGGLRNGKIMKRKDTASLVNGFAKTGSRTKPLNGAVVDVSGEDKPEAEEEEDGLHDEENDSADGPDGIVFEYEESDRPLPPLYALKDEHNERWVLMSDLCHVLKFKSKEAVLRQICPNNAINNQRDLIREMKIEEFLARANCLQLLCAGEKLNIHASKVVLVKYNDSVKSLLQVKSVMTRI